MEPEVTQRRDAHRARVASAALIGLGLAALYEASSLPFGTARQPDSGLFPVSVTVALILFAAIAIADGPPPPRGEATAETGGNARIWAVIVALAVYAGLITPVGFIVSTAALLVLLLRGIGRVSWAASAAGAVLGSVGCYWLFTRLGMPLPAGILGF